MATAVIIPARLVVDGVPQPVRSAFVMKPYDLGRRGHQLVFAVLTDEGQWTRAGITPLGGSCTWMCTYEGEKIGWRFQSYAEMGEDRAARERYLVGALHYAAIPFEQRL